MGDLLRTLDDALDRVTLYQPFDEPAEEQVGGPLPHELVATKNLGLARMTKRDLQIFSGICLFLLAGLFSGIVLGQIYSTEDATFRLQPDDIVRTNATMVMVDEERWCVDGSDFLCTSDPDYAYQYRCWDCCQVCCSPHFSGAGSYIGMTVRTILTKLP